MSRIFFVQPNKVLQQAVIVALFPEHQVRVFDKIPETEPSAHADLVIIDGGALRDRGWLSAGDIRAVQSWQIPTVWIGAEASEDRAAAKNRAQLTAPLKRDELRAAVTESLRSSLEQPAAKPAVKVPRAPSAKKKTAAPNPDSLVADHGRDVIELVEVIEEIPDDGGNEAEAGNQD